VFLHISPQNNFVQNAMKTIVLLPKTDVITLCLPEQWVGVPVICKFAPMNTRFIDSDEMELEIEKRMIFSNKKRRKRKKDTHFF